MWNPKTRSKTLQDRFKMKMRNNFSVSSKIQLLKHQRGASSFLVAILVITTISPHLLNNSSSNNISSVQFDNVTQIDPISKINGPSCHRAAVGVDDSYEYNDDFAGAVENASITIGSQLTNLAASYNSPDIFYITNVYSGYVIFFHIVYDSTETNFDINVYDVNQNLISKSIASGNNDFIELDFTSASFTMTQLYVRIYVANETHYQPLYDDDQLYTYTLDVNQEDRFESIDVSNNDFTNYTDIPMINNPSDLYFNLTTSCLIRPTDYYRFLVWKDNYVNISISGNLFNNSLFTGTPFNPLFSATLYDSNQIQLDNKGWSFLNENDSQSITFIASSTAYYYVRFWYQDNTNTQTMYQFSLVIDDNDDGYDHSGNSFAAAPSLNYIALSFDGFHDYVDFPDFSLSNNFTVELSVNPYTTADQQCFIGKHSSVGGNLFLVGYYGGNYLVILRDLWWEFGTKMKGWHHLAVVGVSNNTHTNVTVYRNDEIIGNITTNQVMGELSGKGWTLGQDWDSATSRTDFFYGQMDNVRLINRSLSEDEIKEDAKSFAFSPARSDTVAWWKMDEGSGFNVSDSSGNDYAGTIIGATWSNLREGEKTGLWTSSLYPDYYKLDLNKDERLTLNVNFYDAMSDINVYLFNDSTMNELLMASTTDQDQERLTEFRAPRDGTYYLFMNSSDSGQRYYNLTYYMLPPDDIYEDNDGFTTAALLLTKNETYSLFLDKEEADYFVLNVAYDDFLNITLTFDITKGYLNLFLYDGIYGNTLNSSTFNSSILTITWRCTSDFIPVVLEVIAPSGGGIADVGLNYELFITVITGDDQYEVNDELNQAYAIGEGSFPRLIVRSTSVDYFKLFLKEDEELEVDLHYTYTYGDVDLYILDSLGSEVLKSETPTDDEIVEYTVQADGIYYLLIFLSPGTGSVNTYSLDICYSDLDDLYEDNDSPDNPVSIAVGWHRDIMVRIGDPDYYNITLTSIRAISIYTEFDTFLGDLSLELYLPNGTLLVSGATYSSGRYILLLPSEVPEIGAYLIKVSVNNTDFLKYDLYLNIGYLTTLDTTVGPISSMSIPAPKKTIIFLPIGDFDYNLAVMLFFLGLAVGGVSLVLLRRRRTSESGE